jgi:hypothetical protein
MLCHWDDCHCYFPHTKCQSRGLFDSYRDEMLTWKRILQDVLFDRIAISLLIDIVYDSYLFDCYISVVVDLIVSIVVFRS